MLQVSKNLFVPYKNVARINWTCYGDIVIRIYTYLHLALRSGIPSEISRSKRPARLRAGSSESTRLVAPTTITWASVEASSRIERFRRKVSIQSFYNLEQDTFVIF